jgi:hypothetical protein
MIDAHDVQLVAPQLTLPIADFTRHYQPVTVDEEIRYEEFDEYSETEGWSESDTVGQTITDTVGFSVEVARGITQSLTKLIGGSSSQSKGISHEDTEGESSQEQYGSSTNQSESQTDAKGWNDSSSDRRDNRMDLEGETISKGQTGSHSQQLTTGSSENESFRTGENSSESDGWNKSWTDGDNWSNAENDGTSLTVSKSRSRSRSVAKTSSHTVGRNGSRTVAHRRVPMLFPIREWLDTGKLATSIQDQMYMMMQRLMKLRVGECLMLSEGNVVQVRINFTPDNCAPKWKRGMINKLRRMIWKWHDCYFQPNGEVELWDGKTGINGSSKRSRRIPATPRSSSKPVSSPATRWRSGGSGSNGNGKK